MVERLNPQSLSMKRWLVPLVHPVVWVSIALHALVLLIPASPGSNELTTEAETEVAADTVPTTPVPQVDPPGSPVPSLGSSSPTPAPAPVAIPSTRATAPSAGAGTLATPTPTANSAIAAIPRQRSALDATTERRRFPVQPPVQSNGRQRLTARTSTEGPTAGSESTTLPTLQADTTPPVTNPAPARSPAPTPRSSPRPAARVSALPATAPPALQAYVAAWREDYRHRSALTDPKRQQKALEAWQDEIEIDPAIGAAPLPVTPMTLAIASPVRVCLTPPPQAIVFGVVVTPQGDLVQEPTLLGSSGYRGINQVAEAAIADTRFPVSQRPRLYEIVVAVDDIRDTCIPPIGFG